MAKSKSSYTVKHSQGHSYDGCVDCSPAVSYLHLYKCFDWGYKRLKTKFNFALSFKILVGICPHQCPRTLSCFNLSYYWCPISLTHLHQLHENKVLKTQWVSITIGPQMSRWFMTSGAHKVCQTAKIDAFKSPSSGVSSSQSSTNGSKTSVPSRRGSPGSDGWVCTGFSAEGCNISTAGRTVCRSRVIVTFLLLVRTFYKLGQHQCVVSQGLFSQLESGSFDPDRCRPTAETNTTSKQHASNWLLWSL